MDKYEYRIKAEQIRKLVEQEDYPSAMKIANTIDWNRVKSIPMLCLVSDIYNKCDEYTESRDIMLIAYERHPNGRMIVFSLAELSIKLGEFVDAVEYYKEFVQIAPRDTGRYVLQYKLYEAQQVTIEEKIAVLEEFKKHEYHEQWAYELARLYYQAGMSQKCIAECDDIILWFSEGRYVEKAMELKMLYQPLTPEQQKKYDHRNDVQVKNSVAKVEEVLEKVLERQAEEEEQDKINVKPMSPGIYDTINLQAELANSLKQIMDATEEGTVDHTMSNIKKMLEDSQIIGLIPPEMLKKEPVQEEQEDLQNQKKSELGQEAAEADETAAEPDVTEADEPVAEPDREEAVLNNTESDKGSEFEKLLAEDRDGQISLYVPEETMIEKQITGQMSIEEVLTEWERMKAEAQRIQQERESQANETLKKRLEAAKQKAIQETEDIMDRLSDIVPQLNSNVIPFRKDKDSAEEMKETEEFEEEADERAEELEEFAELAEEYTEEDEQEASEEAIEEKDDDDAAEGLEARLVEGLPESICSLVGEKKEEEFEKECINSKTLPDDYKKIFTYFAKVEGVWEQLVDVLDSIKEVPGAGNVVIMGNAETGKTTLALDIVKAVKKAKNQRNGKLAKTTGEAMNTKNVAQTLKKIAGGVLIIEKAGMMKPDTIRNLSQAMGTATQPLLIIMEDSRNKILDMFETNKEFAARFPARVDLPAYRNDDLVTFGRSYAREMEYDIDEMGVLALYTRIDELQLDEHIATLSEVKAIIDEAIEISKKKSFANLKDSLLRRRYSENGFTILQERDFLWDKKYK